jgi:hypothetical protein
MRTMMVPRLGSNSGGPALMNFFSTPTKCSDGRKQPQQSASRIQPRAWLALTAGGKKKTRNRSNQLRETYFIFFYLVGIGC